MQLQASVGVASMHMYGPSETACAALTKGLAIAEARRNVLRQVGIIGTLSMFSTRHGQFKIALDHAKRARAIARSCEEPNAVALAQSALGRALHFMGDHSGARSELEAVFRHWSRAQRTYLGLDDRVLVGLGLARTLWAQGFPAQAVERAQQTLNDAKLSGNPASLAVTLSWVPGIFIWTGDRRSAEEHTDWLISHAESHSLAPYLHVGRAHKGTLAICCGNAKAGVETLQGCLEHLHAVHYEMRNTEFRIFLTLGLMAIGRVDEGMALIDETIGRVGENGELFFLPEALRVKAGLLLSMPHPNSEAAEACFAQSLELSRNQGARAWELRTATDLAALWASRGRRDEARALLLPIFEQFTEGADTADLNAAQRLLATL